MRCGNIQIDQFIRTGPAISGSQFNRITGVSEIHEVDSFYRFSLFDIQTGDNSLG